MHSPNHLIIVCGHAIWKGGPNNGWDEAEWLIESYKRGETPTFIEHIKAGVTALSKDERAVLIFSGGPTRQETTTSEARSYRDLAVANSFFGLFANHTVEDLAAISSSRILLEERALDSYYNIIFSIIEFWRRFAVWPERLTIVSHAFKRNRLVDGHCAAIGFPLDRVDFIGINPPGVDALKLDLAPPSSSSSSSATKAATETGAAVEGLVSKEKANAMQGVQLAIGQWAEDPHGVGEELAGKRRQRNCWNVDQRFFLDDEERERSGVDTQLLEHGTETLVEGGRRPWANYD